MGRKTALTTLLLLSALVLFMPLISRAEANLLSNPGFEEAAQDMPVGWQTDTWIKDRVITRFYLTKEDPHSGRYSIVIDTREPEDAKLLQRVSLQPESLYRFSCWVKAANIPLDAKGANISVLGILDTSEDIRETNGKWRLIEFYGRTEKAQTEAVFSLRLGGYGSLNKGRAVFDDCEAQKIDTLPSGKSAPSLMPPKKDPPKTDSNKLDITPLVITAIFFMLFFTLLQRFLLTKQTTSFQSQEKLILYAVFAAALLLRLVLSYKTTGFPVDLQTYKAWAELLAQKGMTNFYHSGHFVDYPPLYMYAFYIAGKLRLLLNIHYDSPAFVLLLKAPSIIAELLSAWLILVIARGKVMAVPHMIMILLLYVFNPVIIIDSSLWGQIDSVLTLPIAASLLALMNRRLVLASALFSCAVLIKPQALMFTPIFLLYVAVNRDLKETLRAAAVSAVVLFIIILPFSWEHGFGWLIRIFKNAFVQYPFSTLNAFNIYALFGKNWAPVAERWFIFSFKTWGTISIILITAASAYMYVRSRDSAKIMLIAIFIILSVFMFSSEMHERYMAPAVLLICIAYVFKRDNTLLYLFAGFTLTNTFNIGYTLMLSHKGIYHLSADDSLLRIFSFFNLILYGLTMSWIIGQLFNLKLNPNKPDQAKGKGDVPSSVNATFKENQILSSPEAAYKPMGRKDLLAISIIALFSACLYLYNLGATVSPATYWKPGAKGEGFYIDFQRQQDLSKIAFFGGLGKGVYRIDISNDLTNWTPLTSITQKDVFQWKSIPVDASTRYLSIITLEHGAALYEIGFFDRAHRLINGFKPYPFAITPTTEGPINNLFDEQQIVPSAPSYMNSTYFDEIYFARTAYEHIHFLEPFENTHPPLGKLFMAGAVKTFGMTPFGWRFAGALSGVLLIVIMYLLGRYLFGSIKYGIVTSLLMGFDFMTFVQARIATVDIFSVTLITAMYYFMFRFHGSKRLLWLALSGLSFGLGISVKWLCVYAGVGLAALFFHRIYRDLKDLGRPFTISLFIQHNRQALIYGALFFVLLPVGIYLVSYIPFMMVPGPGHDLLSVLDYQVHMYKYHKSVKGSHPFASQWWQWPFILKPMWFYMGTELPNGKAASIVSMGNPLLWWTGAICCLFLTFRALIKKEKGAAVLFILVGIASNYVPWILVPRETYIYHFFATVPFITLATVYCLSRLNEGEIINKYLPIIYAAGAIGLFALFYPILSGMTVDKQYISDFLKWFDSWIFFVPDR